MTAAKDLFLVEKGTSGLSSAKDQRQLNARSTTAELVFTECRIPRRELGGRSTQFST